MSSRKVDIKTPTIDYQVIIGENILADQLNSHSNSQLNFQPNQPSEFFYLIDQKLFELNQEFFQPLLNNNYLLFQAGESNKNLSEVEKILEHLSSLSLSRETTLVLIGGGVLGDLGGFVASIYKRGIKFINCPSTLLAMVDSSIGGKTGVNLKNGKNLVGTFYQPTQVIEDIKLLQTLNQSELLNGTGEIVKYSFLNSKISLNQISSNLLNDPVKLIDLIQLCVETKKFYIQDDIFDQGKRLMLNFGHTFGHAIEALTKYQKYSHGYAVVLGIYLAIKFGIFLNYTNPDILEPSIKEFQRIGYNLDLDINYEQLLPYLLNDKKKLDGKQNFILLDQNNQAQIYALEPNEAKVQLTEFLKSL